MTQKRENLCLEKFVGSILFLSFIYNLVYHLSLIDFATIFQNEFNLEFIKFVLFNFLASYIGTFVLFFGLAVNRFLLYSITIALFLLTIISSKYFIQSYGSVLTKTLLDNCLEIHKCDILSLTALLTIFVAWYLVYYFVHPTLELRHRTKILMIACLVLYLGFLLSYNNAAVEEQENRITWNIFAQLLLPWIRTNL
jgi:hypothetical protein